MEAPIWISLVAVALALIAAFLIARKKGRKIVINRVMFVLGLMIALVAALMEFCQERCFLRVDLEGWPAVVGIIGIVLIATSQFHPLRSKK